MGFIQDLFARFFRRSGRKTASTPAHALVQVARAAVVPAASATVRTILVLDVSGSMTDYRDSLIAFLRNYAAQVVNAPVKTARLFFNVNRIWDGQFVSGPKATAFLVDNVPLCDKGTALVDAGYSALEKLLNAAKASEILHLVFLTDGEENESRHGLKDLADAVEKARRKYGDRFAVLYYAFGGNEDDRGAHQEFADALKVPNGLFRFVKQTKASVAEAGTDVGDATRRTTRAGQTQRFN